MARTAVARIRFVLVTLCVLPITACGAIRVRPQATVPPAADIRRVAPQQAERLYKIMVPLLQAMDDPLRPSEVRIGVIDDPSINAANAGGGTFYVTAGLLEKANNEQLRGIMAHEIAHEDLGHVAEMQVLGAGLSVGAYLLEQLFPATGIITPIAGTLIARGYSRGEEYEADRHAVEILRRAGHSRETLIDALTWVSRVSNSGGGGFLSTHPATQDRIERLKSYD
ncbi:MAG TPA: M48 family metallopeptidase [Candidatus Eisenbacteria bacterium]|nr:M48 family metallopeptidase [Candidatus Eisenbacteria bacterium]